MGGCRHLGKIWDQEIDAERYFRLPIMLRSLLSYQLQPTTPILAHDHQSLRPSNLTRIPPHQP